MAAKLKSCENCRVAKAKCVPSTDASTQDCQRCIKYNKTCIYHDLKPRPKRGKQAHTRVADVEKKLDDIYSLLQGEQPDTDDSSHRPSIVATNGANSIVSSNVDSLESPPPQQQSGEAAASGHLEQHHHHKHRDRDAIDKEILSEKEAEELFQVYHNASRDFPFVYISPEISLDTLRHEKPFLLLSILTMCSQRVRPLQVLLEKELRETLASKVIIQGELSLDVLQGLMIYLAWYHHNFRPFRQQIYQLTQLCGSMVIDLELHKPSDLEPDFVIHPSKACLAGKKDTAPEINSKSEALRTFLGAYFLTTSISIMLRKPNGMAYSNHVDRCCKELAEIGDSPMDRYLIYYINLTRLHEDICSTFGYCSGEMDIELSQVRTQGTVRAFVARAQDISKSLPPEVYSMPSIMSILYAAPNMAYEIIFHLDARSDSDAISPLRAPKNGSQAWYTSAIRTDLSLSCLDSIQSSLDWYIELPDTEYERLNLLDTSRIAYQLLLLGRLTLSGVPGSEVEMAQQLTKLEYYFDALVGKYQSLIISRGLEDRKSIYWHLQRNFLTSKEWLSGKIKERIRMGAALDPVHVAKMTPNFQTVETGGVIDLDKQDVETVAPGFKVVAGEYHHGKAEADLQASSHGIPSGNPTRSWAFAMSQLPGTEIGGSLFF